MALRLTSNLLYGVALIYKQKTDYLNNDTSVIRTKLQRDLFSASNNGNGNILIRQPNYIIKPTDLNQISHSGNPSDGGGGSGANQVLMNDDPSFNVNDGLLPSLDDLDFLGPSVVGGTQVKNTNQRKSQIRKADMENNTVSVILSTMSNSTEDQGDVFTRHRIVNDDDEIMETGNPEFAFDEEGMLLSLHDDETTGQNAGGLEGIGTSARAMSTPQRDDQAADFDFDFDFGVDMDRVEAPPVPASGVGNELDQILEEVGEDSHVQNNQDAQVNQDGRLAAPAAPAQQHQRKRRRVNNIHFTEIIMDDNISLQTNDLRTFRDNYVESMESQRKLPKLQTITIQDLMIESNEFLPNFQDRNDISIDEQRRGRTRERDNELVEGDEDFVDELLRKTRRSSESIEVRRNTSSTRRHSTRASMSSIHLPLDNDNPRDETTAGGGGGSGGGEFDFDFDFDFGNVHDYEEQQYTNSDSRKRSSSVQRFPVLEENEEHHFHDDINIETREIEKKTIKFLTFIEKRFDEDAIEMMNFEQLMNQEDDSAHLNRSVIVKSFYEILQLATLNTIEIIKGQVDDKFQLLNDQDFSIKLHLNN